MLGEKKISIQQKMTKIGTFENKAQFDHSKIHNHLLVKIFVAIFFNPYFFSIMYHILIPYKKNIEMKS
jgi:hypothetical protein